MAGRDDVLLACTIGDLSWLKRGLSRKLDPNSTNKEGLNGLHLAALNGKLRCMQYLLDNCSINVNKVACSSGSTALHYSISNKNSKSAQCLKLLMERGANLNTQNRCGYSALHLAAKCGNIQCLRALLESGANIHIVDLNDNTAYNVACLHNQHECARLLRALHWANDKDATLQETLRDEVVKQNRQKEITSLQTRLKKEVADEAYTNWFDKNNVVNYSEVLAPCACSERKEVRSRLDKPSSCATCCSQMTSKHQSAILQKPKVAQPIKVTLDQADRNVGSVGKPDKLYPYANHPPQTLRKHDSSGKETDISEPRTSSRTVGTHVGKTSRQVPTGVKYYSKVYHRQNDHTPQQQNSYPQTINGSTANKESWQDEESESESSEEDEEDADLQQLPFVFEDESYYEDDIAFHDVGHENSLDALELPPALTKGKTPAEIVQLLRCLGNPGPRAFKRSHSVASGPRNGFSKKIHHQRRLSLGAIPEGRIVTSYSDEDASGSQVLDEQFLATIMSQHSESNKSSTEHNYSDQSENNNGSLKPCEPDSEIEETITISADVQSHEAPTLPSSRRKTSPPHSLKIVNLAWDSVSNSVQPRSSASPIPPAEARLHTPTRKITPPPTYNSTPHITPPSSTPTRKPTPPHNFAPTRKLSPPSSTPTRKPTPPHNFAPTRKLSPPSSTPTRKLSPPSSTPTRKPTPPSSCNARMRKITPPSLPRSPYEALNSFSEVNPPSSCNARMRKITPRSLPRSPYDGLNSFSEDEMSPRSLTPTDQLSPPETPRHTNTGLHSHLLYDSTTTPAHSLFAISPLASKSMVLDSSDNETQNNEDTSHKRRKSAPDSSERLQNMRVLKTTVFEFGGILKHS